MGLSEYRRKRDFSKTPEPRGEVVEGQRKSPPLRFVVQKHASTLVRTVEQARHDVGVPKGFRAMREIG